MKLGSLLVLAYSCAEFKIPLTLVAHVKFNKKNAVLDPFINFVSFAFANESISGKSVRKVYTSLMMNTLARKYLLLDQTRMRR